MKLFSENKRYWRALLITVLFWFIMALCVNALWPYYHMWLVNVSFYGIIGFWIGQTLSKFVKLPKGVGNVLKVIGIVAVVIIYFEMPKYQGFYQGRGANMFSIMGIFAILGWMLPYVEEEKDRFWEWLAGSVISFMLVAFVTYMSNYVSVGDCQLYYLGKSGIDLSVVEVTVGTDLLSRPAKIANSFIIVPVLPAVYCFQKLMLSHTAQEVLFKKKDYIWN